MSTHLSMSQDAAHNWQAANGGKRDDSRWAGYKAGEKRPELSFDGCGINGPDEYRTRLCTFGLQRWDAATVDKYGRLFEAAPEMLEALKRAELSTVQIRMAADIGKKTLRKKIAWYESQLEQLRQELRGAIAKGEATP